jgi:hypothetical protein
MENFEEDASAAMSELMEYIRQNTGLLGGENPGRASFHLGGRTMEIISPRPRFDTHDHLLAHIENDGRYIVKAVGVKTVKSGEQRPSIVVGETLESQSNTESVM